MADRTEVQPVVGEGVTVCRWSDRDAATIVAVTPSGKSFDIQLDNATLLNGANSGEPDALKMAAGGFAGHTTGVQRWKCEPAPEGPVHRVRLTKRGWMLDGQRVIAGRHHHHDFNF
jgi:hypothetical protein